ncbi:MULTISPECIES: tryptophan halogenase family protein [unclassified Novosphingobium]|uniref:tryptophan halogenase family protein n=1 Tax=unclassified Novosphingobium TaxID=2644732 RepID=UPI000D2FF4B5|nr:MULTISPECIES: tryptophan halogenase family protein [unclassified Novosphingobium]PTR13348.1 tryptophan halogenase [Novosphingobium sp. GV055]PUB07567.1 tryptophan halogenase [Novosphingobium sp. GV061]PUB23380.1 tryptophan halogenase [Novosphingobium sp. GV079]PUB45144.1 tryptophan halogenase [Novosphingobium sp. GV027]
MPHDTAPSHIRSIVIAGGGTAGWMVAAALSRTIAPHRCRITLVESETIGTIGVGEATIPPIQTFNQVIGLDEAAFLQATKGTFKLGIEFAGWRAREHRYFHPFGRQGNDFGGTQFHQHWLRAQALGDDTPLGAFSLNEQAAYAGKMRQPDGDPRSVYSTFSYAYHFDATLYGQHLRALAEERGVERREGLIQEVVLDGECGRIASLRLDDGGMLDGDLFIDCTGLRSLLLGEALGVPFEDWTHFLPCNRALAVPTDCVDLMRPYTRSTAHEAGWQWRIPLQHRMGNGMVYSAEHWSDDQAHAALMANLDGQPLADPRLIRFTTGRRVQSWAKNCVAIGLSAGFLEPLESTSIHLVQIAVAKLLNWFPDMGFDPMTMAEFNRQIANEYDRIRDFLVLHYHANEREGEPFWDQCRTGAIPDSLAEKIAMFRRSGRLLSRETDLFQDASWLAVLLGQGVMPQAHDPLTESLRPLELDQMLRGMRDLIGRAAQAMPSQADHLARIGGTIANAQREAALG